MEDRGADPAPVEAPVEIDPDDLEAGAPLVVAIDGPSGSGKSTVARAVANELGLRYLDTGAMYRAVTDRVLAAGIDPSDAEAVAALAGRLDLRPGTDPAAPTIVVDGIDLSAQVRSPAVTAAVSTVSAVPAVRARLVDVQRLVIGAGGIVVEGRDIGTTVAPSARLKVFLTAHPRARAERRTLETTSRLDDDQTATTEADLLRRDTADSTRAASPLVRADDAVEIDTTELGVDDVVARVLDLARHAARTASANGGTRVVAEPLTGAWPGGRAPAGPVDTGPLVRSRTAPSRIVMGLARLIGRVLFPFVFRLRVIGRDRLPAAGPVILAGNHTGFLDGPTVFSTARRTAFFFIKAELYGGRGDVFLDWLGQIPINRGRPDRTALRRGLDVLAAGGVLGMFPEGTRGSGDLETVQHGIGYLALRGGCPVVPVACFGTRDALPKGRKLPRWRTPVDVVYGEPFQVSVDAEPRTRRAVALAAEEIRRHLVDHLAAAAELTGRTAATRPDSR